MFTIIVGGTVQLYEVGKFIAKFRRDVRNMIDRNRKQNNSWNNFELVGWLETDSFHMDEFMRLGPDKRLQVAEFVTPSLDHNGVVWLPSVHGVVRLGPKLDFGMVRTAFEHQWPGSQRVNVTPFDSRKPMHRNLGDVINYSLKNKCSTAYYDEATGHLRDLEWDARTISEYYVWLHGWSRGFQSLRITVKPKNIAGETEAVDKRIAEYALVEPMCIAYGFSAFPIDYRY